MAQQDCPAGYAEYWLPPIADFDAALADAGDLFQASPPDGLSALSALATHRLDFLQVRRIDKLLKRVADRPPADVPFLRIAMLGDETLDHLAAPVRVAALRRGLVVDVHVGPFGQWRQQILDPNSALHDYAPDCVLIAPDYRTMVSPLAPDASAEDADAAVTEAVSALAALWRSLRERTGAAVLVETPWREDVSLYGSFERQVPSSPGFIADLLDTRLVAAARRDGVLLLDLRRKTAGGGYETLHDEALWHHAKQAITPQSAPWFGEQVARILGAVRGLSKKVVVVDLDNTLWGGVIGDDGLDGLVLGQGSAAGEAFAAFQNYLKRLSARGIALAVSSKNDDGIARAAFADHPEMVLALDDFAAFEANWNDKPSALRRISEELSLGLDSFVFVDDNPAERDLMRRTLPQVAVPELPAAPEAYARCIADAGYFEAVAITAEDTQRSAQYVANRARRELESGATDMESFLRDLDMTLEITPFRCADLARITQLINKTNQFNLTTHRYTDSEVRAAMDAPDVITVAGRLRDRFGDNGLTSVVICRRSEEETDALEIDTWLMSCRILGRGVEHAILGVVAAKAAEAGGEALIGRYRPTRKNDLVKDLYPRLGFLRETTDDTTGETIWRLPLGSVPVPNTDYLHLKYE